MIQVPHRRRPRVALRLMGAAVRELVLRGYTHLVTDVFEGERHSPLDFHVRVLGARAAAGPSAVPAITRAAG